jgi:outer membrane protein assembly factor BamB
MVPISMALAMTGLVQGSPSIRVVHRDPTNSSYGLSARVLVVSASRVVIATAGGIIRALDISETGPATVAWEYQHGQPVGAPAVNKATGIAAFASQSSVVAVQCATGSVVWEQHVAGYVDAEMLHVQQPSPMFVVGTYSGAVYALDEGTGEIAWSTSVGAPIALAGAAAAQISDANGKPEAGVVVVTMAGRAAGMSLSSGRVSWGWDKPTPLLRGAYGATPLVTAAGLVLLPSIDGSLYAVDPAGPPQNGSSLWSFESNFAIDSSPAEWQGIVVLGSDDQHIYGIDAATGVQLWTVVTGDWVQCSPLVSPAGIAWIGSNDGILYGINATNGDILAQANPSNATLNPSPIMWTPHGATERLVPQGTGRARPAEQWSASEGAGLSEPPLIPGAFEQGSILDQWAHVIAKPALLADGTVITATTRGVVAAITLA